MPKTKYSRLPSISVNHFHKLYEEELQPEPANTDLPGIGGTPFKLKLDRDWFSKTIDIHVLIIKPFSLS